MLIVLDAGPIGLLSNPTTSGPSAEARAWAQRHLEAGDRLVVPEIADYEVRRELLRAERHRGVQALDRLGSALGYAPLTTSVIRDAAELWARARNEGQPTAHEAALDGDVILAAQARSFELDDVVVATTNARHLERYVTARVWTEI